MSYRMLATDLDGTLLNSKGEVSANNKDAIRRASERGVPIILCSGRAPGEGVAALGKSLGLDYPGNYYICCSGAMLVDAATQEIAEGNYLSVEAAEELLQKAESLPAELRPEQVRLCTTEAVYYWGPEDALLYDQRFCIRLPSLLENLWKIKGEITKMLFLSEAEDYASRFFQAMEPLCPSKAVGYIMPPIVEYVSSDAQKGKAVSRLAERLGISAEEVICVGDGYNDVSMIEQAGLGIAVKNATELLCRKADVVLPCTNDEDAIREIIDTYLLK